MEAVAVTVNLQALAGEHESIQSRVLKRALQDVAGERFTGFDQIDRLRAMASPDGPAVADLPGVRAERLGGRLRLTRKAANEPAGFGSWNNFRYPLSIPGEVLVPEAGCRIEAERVARAVGKGQELPLAARGETAVIDAAGLSDTLSVRGRRQGDSFRPLGLSGRKKLQDFFVDRKVPRARRDRVPIVVDEQDRIIWVAGHAISEEFRVSDRTQSMVVLRLRDLGGLA
jgi:tRNA(Ile)-lysidine synthase